MAPTISFAMSLWDSKKVPWTCCKLSVWSVVAIHNLFKFVLFIDGCVQPHCKWKVMTAHPEKGGDPKTFQKLNKAVTVSKIRWKMHKTELTEQRHKACGCDTFVVYRWCHLYVDAMLSLLSQWYSMPKYAKASWGTRHYQYVYVVKYARVRSVSSSVC